jgi:outer membrane receptor for ferrienterochelin and colicins
MKNIFLLFFLILFLSSAYSQTEVPTDSVSTYYDMDLDSLRKIKASGVSSELEKLINSLIGVASQKSLSTRESPSIVSLITEEEIRKSGARDLIDVLRLVPGFDFAYNGENALGVGVRGNWVNEGKMLLLMDGMEMNEIFSANLSFGNHYPIANISRIEIIRGPGSAIYGGFAQFGVINIITKKGSDIDGATVQATYGQMQNSLGRRNFDFAVGKKIKDVDISLSGLIGESNRSDQNSFLSFGQSQNLPKPGFYSSLADNSKANPTNLTLKAHIKDFSIKAIYDDYQTNLLTLGTPQQKRFLTYTLPTLLTEMKYVFHVGQKFQLTPRVSYINQTQRINGLPDSINFSQNQGTRWRTSLVGNYDPSRKLNIVAGSEFFHDNGTNAAGSVNTLNGNVGSISYDNIAFFGQLTAKTRIVNIVIGGRYDNNSTYGEALVPRFGLTKKVNRVHFKLLYSGSFRAPSIQNIARGVNDVQTYFATGVATAIKPEKTTVFELETGYQLSRDIFATFNFFSNSTTNPIVYSSDFRIYSNVSSSSSRGLEAELRIKKKWGYLTANYSLYTVDGESRITLYQTKQLATTTSQFPDGEERNGASLLAFPNHKFTINSSIQLTNKLSINPSFIFNGTRYGYDQKPIGNNSYAMELKAFDPALISNLMIRYESLLVKGLNGSIGSYNIFDTKFDYLTPSYSQSGVLPSTSREWLVRLEYRLNF